MLMIKLSVIHSAQIVDNVIPNKPPIENGAVYTDTNAYRSRLHVFFKNNLYNSNILVIDISLFIKNENTRDENLIKLLFDSSFKGKTNRWAQFVQQKRDLILKNLMILFDSLSKRTDCTTEELVIRDIIPTLDKDDLVNTINKMIILNFSLIDIKHEQKYTTNHNINSFPAWRVFIRNPAFPGDKSSSIFDFQGEVTKEQDLNKLFDLMMMYVVKYVLYIYIAPNIAKSEYNLLKENINKAYDTKYNIQNANNAFQEI